MDEPPTDPRVRAMLAALLGSEWEKLEGDVAFERAPVTSWVLAAETMLGVADGADPLRNAIRSVIQEGGASERSDSTMPSQAQQ